MATLMHKKMEPMDIFPFTIVYRDTKNPQTELPNHIHEWYELVYVHSGKGSFFIDQVLHEKRAGDLFVIPGNTIHQAFTDPADPIVSTALFFSPELVQPASFGEEYSFLLPFDYCKVRNNFVYLLSSASQEQIEQRLNAIQEELLGKNAGYRHAIVLHVQQLLLELSRLEASAGDRDRASSPASGGPLWLRESLKYIDLHLDQPLGLDELSRQASVTGAHYSRVFKQLTGMGVAKYVMTKRIIRAKELLLAGDNTISTIAEQCGFESLPHFYRQFKRIAGLTPAAYRKRLLSSR
ncbi:AraC family transcriptional regulator [Paenibacillaceae bacterium]|nr:AraC family transcriptional regulator [Paenibacillaceae bacterium]